MECQFLYFFPKIYISSINYGINFYELWTFEDIKIPILNAANIIVIDIIIFIISSMLYIRSENCKLLWWNGNLDNACFSV